MRINFLLILISLFLASCGSRKESPYWRFRLDNGNVRAYYESNWTCYHEKEENSFYVECFERLSGDMDSFYAVEVEYRGNSDE